MTRDLTPARKAAIRGRIALMGEADASTCRLLLDHVELLEQRLATANERLRAQEKVIRAFDIGGAE